MNGDGIDDLAVSAPTAGFEELHYNGAVYVYFGSYRGLATEPVSTSSWHFNRKQNKTKKNKKKKKRRNRKRKIDMEKKIDR